MTRQALIVDARERITACTACERMDPYRRFQSCGNPNSRWMLIGEAPGEDSIKQGRHWLGVSGRRLRGLVSAVPHQHEPRALDLDTDFYLTDLVKCLPPVDENGDRPVWPADAQSCLPLLEAELEAVQPLLIVSVGKLAADHILRAFGARRSSWPCIKLLHADTELRLVIPTRWGGCCMRPFVHPARANQFRSGVDEYGDCLKAGLRTAMQMVSRST